MIDVDTGSEDQAITMVPVAAILVAGIKLHFLDDVLDLRYRGKNRIGCHATFEKGDELGKRSATARPEDPGARDLDLLCGLGFGP